MFNFNYEYKKNNTFQELQTVLKDNKLFEETYNNSRFLSIINNKSDEFLHYGSDYYQNENIKLYNFTTVVAVDSNGETVGILTYENYKTLPKQKTFICEGEKLKFQMTGFVCLYVKPEFRGLGIAINLVKTLNKQYVFNKDVIQLICGVQATSFLLQDYMTSFVFTQSAYSESVWKESAKSHFKYHRNRH